MQCIRNIKVPTGNILVVKGEKGSLECLSIGDYGKDINLKADFMGLTRDIQKVQHTNILPLTEKMGYHNINTIWLLHGLPFLRCPQSRQRH